MSPKNPFLTWRHAHNLTQTEAALVLNTSVGIVYTLEHAINAVIPAKVGAALRQILTPEEELAFVRAYYEHRREARQALKSRVKTR